jgi:S-DNA-T family DNA segregation ATPase FtsK/SpoIIIE
VDDHEDYLGPYAAVGETDEEFRGPENRGMAPFEDEEIVLAATAGTWWGPEVAMPAGRGMGSDEGSHGLVKESEESNSALECTAQGPEDRLNVSVSSDHLAAQREESGPVSSSHISQQALEEAIEEYAREEQGTPIADVQPKCRKKGSSRKGQAKSVTVARRADEEIVRAEHREDQAFAGDDYVFPSLDLLDSPPSASRCVDEKLLERNASTLEQKLGDLGIRGEVVAIHPGPVITMYELNLAAGVPLRKVLSTADDLAMALKSGSTRVVAPIHGKDTVGIEVPNLNREIVHFREIIESPVFEELDSPLKVAIGKGIEGKPFATSLTGMPHLLIAGATGTGKSVGLNSLICSWLMYCHPDDLKLLMVDPKKLELSYYQDIPHLLHPVVTEAEKVPKVLSWAIREMERRYDLLSKAGAKNVESYNRKILFSELIGDSEATPPEKLPYIVIIVDELAELMMVAAKDIEISIARLAQMARASGIHLILATQRPSVDVITGVIKANFPARISYQVSARPDSRTILDTTGAEHLLGMGDMLFLPPGVSKLIRLHGAYVSENEIRRIVDFIKAQRAPVYLQEIARHVSEPDPSASGGDFLDDPKYDEAVELVSRLGHASISLIQRHMRIGYNRAARIIEAMEGEGLIGPSDGTSRPREVLVRALDADLDRGRESFV